jgi:ribosomal protein S12 methylthiotransferase accessory factor
MNERVLRDRLAERSRRSGHPAPVVAGLGTRDVTGDSERADLRDATIHLTPQGVLIGPWGGAPEVAACGHCLAIRWQRLRTKARRDTVEGGSEFRAARAWPLLTGHLLDTVWAAYRAAYHRPAGERLDGLARVTAIDPAGLTLTTVPVLAESRCPSCATARQPDRGDADPLLRSRVKPHPGAYRLRHPVDYALPVDALTNGVCGAIGRDTTPLLTLPTTAPAVGGFFARSLVELHEMRWSGQSNGYGLSRLLGLLEGLERASGSLPRANVAPVVGSYRELADDALDPRDCGTYPDEVYATSDLLEPFDPDQPVDWAWGYSLRDERPVLVPHRVCYYGSGRGAGRFVLECSNGCASGGSLEEAILFGLLELIERDAFLIGWYGSLDLTEIDLGDSADPGIRVMTDRARLLGYRIRLFDNRIDLAVPAVTAVAERVDGGPGLLSFTAGASLDPHAAIAGALSELCTYIPTLAASYRQRPDELEAMAADYDRVTKLADHGQLFTVPTMREQALRYLEPRRRVPQDELYAEWERVRPRSTDLLDDVAFCRDELVKAGHDVIVVDQTSSEQRMVGVRSVCMVVPGLVPIDFGWRLQRALHMPRTFSAPRRGGLRSTDLSPADLHRVPHPFP